MNRTIRGLLLVGVFLAPGLSHATPHPLEFEVLTEFAGGPPYPTNAIELLVEYPPDDIKPGIPTELLSLSLNAVSPVDLQVEMRASLSSASEARIDFFASKVPDDTFPATVFFDLFVDAAPHPDDPLAAVGGIAPCMQPGDASFFDLLFDVELNSFAAHLAHFEIASGQALGFLDPTAEPNADGAHALFGIERTSGVPQQLLFSMTLTGNFVHTPEPASLTLLALGLAGIGFSRRRTA